MSPIDDMLKAGERILVGSSFVEVSEALAASFVSGDSLIGIPQTRQLLHVPRAQSGIAYEAVSRAVDAFSTMSGIDQARVSRFFDLFADALSDDERFAPIMAANSADVESAKLRGRSTTRLIISDAMRADMIAGLRMWSDAETTIGRIEERVVRDGLEVEAVRAPLGPVAFVFEGRPNVFADATGVLRSGNTVVFRIGSDALLTAEAIMEHAVVPALTESGLPIGAVSLVASRDHAAGWALFSDSRLALAVARGSGEAVAQLGAIARQAGIPVSLHGTGGAWMIVTPNADLVRLRETVRWSLHRKVCNTLNVLCLHEEKIDLHLPIIVKAIADASNIRGVSGIVHLVNASQVLRDVFEAGGIEVRLADQEDLAMEREWEDNPELSIVVIDSLEDAVNLFNTYAPKFIVSVISQNPADHQKVWSAAEAPFVGDGFTRWVDGQFALDKPELGLSNWQHGRMLARSGVLSGDSVYSVRLRAKQIRDDLHR